MGPDAADIKTAATGRWPDIISRLAGIDPSMLDGRNGPCPRCEGRDRFAVFPDFVEHGGVICRHCHPNGGDGLETLRWLLDEPFPTVVDRVADFLGADPVATNGTSVANGKPTETKTEAARRMWDSAKPNDPEGRIAEYLRHRGLEGTVPDDLRYQPKLRHTDETDTFPAIVACIQDVAGRITGVHRTFLDPTGPGKAPVAKPKKMLGKASGGAVRLAETLGETLAIVEGIETGLAVQQATGTPTWATLSTSGIVAVKIPDSVRSVQIWADQDAHGQGKDAAIKLAQRLHSKGQCVRIFIPDRMIDCPSTDWLDVLNVEGADPIRRAVEAATEFVPVAETTATKNKPEPAGKANSTTPPVVDLSIDSVAGGRYKISATCNGRSFTDESFLRSAKTRSESGRKMAERLRIDPGVAIELLDAEVGALVSDAGTAVLTRVVDVEKTEVAWLWHARIPLGSITMLDGLPGCGKSTFTMDLAARVSQGFDMPPYGGPSDADPAGVLLISGEDDASATIAPRLEAVGADLARIHLLDSIEAEGKTRSPAIPIDASRIESAIVEHGVKLVVIDPIMAFLGERVESHVDASVRNALLPLAEMAGRTESAIVLVRHLNKRSGESAINRGGGSIAFVAAARSSLLLGRHPDDPKKRVLASVKCNLAAEPRSLEFRIVPSGSVASCQWIGECDVTADDLVSHGRKRQSANKDDAVAMIESALADGPKPATAINQILQDAGISDSTATRARKEIALKRRKDGLGGGWLWALNTDPAASGPEWVLHNSVQGKRPN